METWMRTILDQLNATNNRPAGFDYLRIILSVSVIAWHTIMVCYGPAAEAPFWTGPLRPLPYVIVPSFFALSGFLVAGSLDRNDIPSFLTLRGLRIFPALAVEVVLSALVIGPLLTTTSLGEYFRSPLLAEYFQNIFGRIHYLLPGVFAGLPAGPSVNMQLWTVPYELECYIAISVLALVRLHRWPKLLFAILVAACLAAFGYQAILGGFTPLDSGPPGRMIVICFLFGVSLYALREHLPWNRWMFAISLVLSWILLSLRQTTYIAPLPVTYLTIYLGLLNPPRTRILQGADYSYGIYLYGFPVQQTISYLYPGSRIWFINLAGSLVVSGLFAFLSWHLIEANVLAQRKKALQLVGKMSRQVSTFWSRVRARQRA
jgi:peptidoglycan/LPS O-acetylase OafA/YrhL